MTFDSSRPPRITAADVSSQEDSIPKIVMSISALLFVRFLLNLYLRGGTAVSGTPSRKRCGSYASEGAIDGQSYKNNTIFHLGGDSCADRSACGVVAAALFALDTGFRAPRCRRFSERQVADGRLGRQAASEAVQPGDARRLLCAGLPWRHAVVRGADRCAPAKPECLYRGRDGSAMWASRTSVSI